MSVWMFVIVISHSYFLSFSAFLDILPDVCLVNISVCTCTTSCTSLTSEKRTIVTSLFRTTDTQLGPE